MKKPKFLNHLDSKGFSHHFVFPIIAVIAVASIGAYVVSKSKAATRPYAYEAGSADGCFFTGRDWKKSGGKYQCASTCRDGTKVIKVKDKPDYCKHFITVDKDYAACINTYKRPIVTGVGCAHDPSTKDVKNSKYCPIPGYPNHQTSGSDACTGPGIASPPSNVKAKKVASESTVKIRRATANIRKDLSQSNATSDISRVAGASDVIGFQEIENPGHVAAVNALTKRGWSVYWPGGTSNSVPIAWRTAQFQLVTSGVLRAHEGKDGVSPSRFVSWAVLRDKTTGYTFANVNGHAVSRAWLPANMKVSYVKEYRQPSWNAWAKIAIDKSNELSKTYGLVLGSADSNRDNWMPPGFTVYYPRLDTVHIDVPTDKGGSAHFDHNYDLIWQKGGNCSTNSGATVQIAGLYTDHDAVVAEVVCSAP